jgi:Patatin-like phospholipase
MISTTDMDHPTRLSTVSSLNQTTGDWPTDDPPPETGEGQGRGEEPASRPPESAPHPNLPPRRGEGAWSIAPERCANVVWSDLARRYTSARVHWFPVWPLILAFAPLLLGVGCATVTHNTVPKDLVAEARVVDMPEVRAWGDEYSTVLQRGLVDSIRQARALDPRGVVDATGAVNVLALSGGGANGAFGAGLLRGWSASGTRPVFKLVTGISTGALIAPFAFLGSGYDATLEDFYTTITTKDIYRERSYLAILFDPSAMVDTTPLQTIVAKQVDDKILAAVAQAHQRGRRLFIGTANLEAGRFVIWDMGAIAASGKPGALELFRKVMLASASIPVAFPPVYIPVEAGGQRYEEMHVDGGTAAQVFFYGFTLDLDAAQQELGIQNRGRVRLFIVRNGKLTVPWQLVSPSILPIADRSLNGLIGSQVVGDLYRIYTITQRDGIEFNLAYIPDDYDIGAQESFDQEAMKRLFQLGYEWAQAGYPWQKLPPGLEEYAPGTR